MENLKKKWGFCACFVAGGWYVRKKKQLRVAVIFHSCHLHKGTLTPSFMVVLLPIYVHTAIHTFINNSWWDVSDLIE